MIPVAACYCPVSETVSRANLLASCLQVLQHVRPQSNLSRILQHCDDAVLAIQGFGYLKSNPWDIFMLTHIFFYLLTDGI